MVAIKRKFVTIYVLEADAAPSSVASSDGIIGEISDYAQTGGQDDTESVPVFGGYVDKDKPTEQFELAFEVIPKITASTLGNDGDRWDSLKYAVDGSNAGVYTSAGRATDKVVYIEAFDSKNTTYKTYGFNNCNGVNWEFSHAADDNRIGTFTFKFSSTTDAGVPNFMTKSVAVTALPLWSALDTE